MIICSDNHVATEADIQNGINNLNSAFAEIQAEGLLDKKSVLSFHNNPATISRPTISDGIIVDHRFAACLTKAEDKAMLLHETGHIHAKIGSVDFLLSVSLALAGLAVCEMLLLAKNAILQVHPKTRKKARSRYMIASAVYISVGLAGWTWMGYKTSLAIRPEESDADLYAARAMKTPNEMQSVLAKLGHIHVPHPSLPVYLDSIVKKNSVAEAYIVKFDPFRFLSLGPLGYFTDSHYTWAQRIDILEKHRREIEGTKPKSPQIAANIAQPS